MCGLFGVVVPVGQRVELADDDAITLRDRLRHRGPDDAGLTRCGNVLFTHRRLAIRDLSAGTQPWMANDESHLVVYNGELYNDRELRHQLIAKGHSFRTNCDTETLSVAYREWGPACVTRLRGQFAIAVYDFELDQLWLARDAFGIKPLFYRQVDDEFRFASEARVLAEQFGNRPAPDLLAVSHYLQTLRITLGRLTMHEGIRTLLPGEELFVFDGQQRHRRWYTLPTRSSLPIEDGSKDDRRKVIEPVTTLLDDAVRKRLVSDVPIGMFLSGGVDSCLLASLLDEQQTAGMRAVCGSGPHGGGDSEFADRYARERNFDFSIATVSSDNYRDRWQHLVTHYGGPVSTPSDPMIQAIAETLREGTGGAKTGVALGGEGADELFGGYEMPLAGMRDFLRLQTASAADPLRLAMQRSYGRDQFADLVDFALTTNSLIGRNAQAMMFREEIAVKLFATDFTADIYRSTLSETGDEQLDPETIFVRMLHRVNLEALLSRLDAATMSRSLESRVPFVDQELVDAVLPLPLDWKLQDPDGDRSSEQLGFERVGTGRVFGKTLLREIAGNRLSPELSNRPKASFPTPVAGWLTTDYRDWVTESLNESRLLPQLFRTEVISDLSAAPERAGMWLWPLMNLAMWGETHFV